MNNIKERIKEFSRLIKKYPNIKELYIERAKLYTELKEYKKAVEDYKKAYTEYYLCKDIIKVCEELGLTKEAEEYYTKEINKDKKNISKYTQRIYFYIRINEIEKAIKDCATVLKLSPKDETILTLKKILTKKN